MQILCPGCRARYTIDDHRLPRDKAVVAHCRRCGHRIDIRHPVASDAIGDPGDGASDEKRQRSGRAAISESGVSPVESIGFGWRALKANGVFLVTTAAMVAVLQFIPQAIGDQLRDSRPIVSGLVSAAAWVFSQFLTLGLLSVVLKVCDGRITGYKEVFQQGRRFPAFIAGSLLYLGLCIIGCLLLIGPGIYWALTYQFYGFIIIEDAVGPLDAMKRSASLTRGFKWRLLAFWVLILLINILGAVPLGLGLLITVPVSMVSMAYVFRRLQGRAPRPAW
jgi:predicted Zn finger-like uncharacterized protein